MTCHNGLVTPNSFLQTYSIRFKMAKRQAAAVLVVLLILDDDNNDECENKRERPVIG